MASPINSGRHTRRTRRRRVFCGALIVLAVCSCAGCYPTPDGGRYGTLVYEVPPIAGAETPYLLPDLSPPETSSQDGEQDQDLDNPSPVDPAFR